ncbi:MAG: ThuA domain-containing protein [Erythrobacter sp.]|nr:ThuA domain-containing protein [Erythrobacter sp.]
MRQLLQPLALVFLLVSSPVASGQDAGRFDAVRPEITQWLQQPAILVFSKTLGWRHNEGIAGADLFFVQLAREHRYGIFTTANAAVFNETDLARFDVVVFNNTTGDGLTEGQESAFQIWLEKGGGWIGLHGSGDASQSNWEWYQDNLIGPRFIGHPAEPQFQDARLEVLSSNHPVTAGIPASWLHNDEWYSFDSRAQDHGMHAIVGLDESTYSPRNDAYGDIADLRMGEGAINHPVIWSRCPKNGRVLYSAIGHSDKSYSDPHYARLLENAFLWVARKIDEQSVGCRSLGGLPSSDQEIP